MQLIGRLLPGTVCTTSHSPCASRCAWQCPWSGGVAEQDGGPSAEPPTGLRSCRAGVLQVRPEDILGGGHAKLALPGLVLSAPHLQSDLICYRDGGKVLAWQPWLLSLLQPSGHSSCNDSWPLQASCAAYPLGRVRLWHPASTDLHGACSKPHTRH